MALYLYNYKNWNAKRKIGIISDKKLDSLVCDPNPAHTIDNAELRAAVGREQDLDSLVHYVSPEYRRDDPYSNKGDYTVKKLVAQHGRKCDLEILRKDETKRIADFADSVYKQRGYDKEIEQGGSEELEIC